MMTAGQASRAGRCFVGAASSSSSSSSSAGAIDGRAGVVGATAENAVCRPPPLCAGATRGSAMSGSPPALAPLGASRSFSKS